MTTTTEKILDAEAADAATMNSWSDRNPATIVKRTAKTIWVQEDRVANLSSEESRESGLTFARGHGDVVIFVRDYDSPIRKYSLRKNGRWIQQGAPANARGGSLTVGRRDYYRDPSF